MKSGGLVKIRVDLLSDRPHAMRSYQLQGTDGCFESARGHGDQHMVWLRSRSPEKSEWIELDSLIDTFMPTGTKREWRQQKRAGHGGGDCFEILDFVDAITGKRPCSIGIHEAMDMTLPGLVSQQSIEQDGQWLDVPDSRAWLNEG